MSRCDSAAMVSNTSELLPEPETPVNAVSRRFGISMPTSLRLFSRAPCTRISSWLSATCGAGDRVSVLVLIVPPICRAGPSGSTQLLYANHVARGVAEGAVANAVGLIGRLLDDLGDAVLQPREGAVEVGGGQEDAGVGALGHHLGDGATLGVGGAGVGARRVQDDGRAGLAGRADRDPAHPAVPDVAPDLEAQSVSVEGQGGVRVVVREEARVDGYVHAHRVSISYVGPPSRSASASPWGAIRPAPGGTSGSPSRSW